MLHYVVKLVKKNDDSLLEFDSDVKSVVQAESVLLDGLSNDIKSVAEELEQIHETIKQEADRLEQAGELKPMSLTELTEQKTAVRVTDGVPQFNKIDHLTGRTPMERFSLNAKVACEQASVSIESIKSKYRALLQYFGEDEQMATSDFFGTLRRFMAEWRKAVEQVDAIEKKEVSSVESNRKSDRPFPQQVSRYDSDRLRKRSGLRPRQRKEKRPQNEEKRILPEPLVQPLQSPRHHKRRTTRKSTKAQEMLAWLRWQRRLPLLVQGARQKVLLPLRLRM